MQGTEDPSGCVVRLARRVARQRTWINRHSPAVTLLSVGVLIAALASVMAHVNPQPHPPNTTFFYDLNTGELFAADFNLVPPIDAPSGPALHDGSVTSHLAGVRAHVFSCTDCGDPSTYFIGYLEYFTAEAKFFAEHPELDPPMDEMDSDGLIPAEQGHLVSRPPEPGNTQLNWAPLFSEDGMEVESDAMASCGHGRAPIECLPQ